MRVFSEMDRFHLAQDGANAVYGEQAANFSQQMDDTLQKHHDFIRSEGKDLVEVEDWKWGPLK